MPDRLASIARRSGTSRAGASDDDALRGRLRAISRERPRWGYRRAHAPLREEGWRLNRKRTQRLWREEGLRVPQRRRKRQRLGESTVPASRLAAERPDQVWALDFQFDQTADGRHAEAAARRRRVHPRGARDRVRAADRRRRHRQGARPARRRPRRRARAHPLRQRPRADRQRAPRLVPLQPAGSAYIEPGSPWQNPYVESFGSRVRDELLAVELFQTALPRRSCSSRTGGTTTTRTDRTRRLA